MQANSQVLRSKLRDFGLDPRQWILESQNRLGGLFQIQLRSTHDRELVLQGWAEGDAWLILSYQGI